MLILAVALTAAGAGSAEAATWTEIPSGTPEDITAVEYRGGDQFWFTTANGKIFRRSGGTFQQVHSQLGVVFRDIEFDAAGTVGLAVGTGGHLARTDNGGATWTVVALPSSENPLSETECDDVKHPAGDLDTVAIDGVGRAWIAGDGAQLWRSTGTGATGTWVNVNNGTADTCNMPRDVDGMFFVAGSESGYFIAKSFGQVYFTSNGLAGAASPKPGDAGNGFQFLRRVTGDPANPNRMWAVFPGDGTSYVQRTESGWNSALDWTLANRDRRQLTRPYDVDYAGGTLVTAGDAGLVVLSTNGVDFYYEDIPGALNTQDWRAVSAADATNAAIGGRFGKLAVTTTANVLPDIVAPTGTIGVSPTTVRAGQPATFTLNAADEGGSGINPGSIRWTSAGLPDQAGNPAQFTFPDQGFATVRVSFADNAGNPAEASVSVTIDEPGAAPVLPVSFTGPGNQLTAKIKGRFIRVTMKGTITLPAGATAAACEQRVTLRIKKKKRVMAHRKARLRFKTEPNRCTFSKKVRLKRKKVGKTRKLRLTVSHPGNTVLQKSSKKLTLVVRK
ncbi:MAG TPA: hypothetical protein VD836_13155 [Solirubrobacteraceae bacterium]|nr:hypothetical protein [Solirubrobacteraceae bacterium]